MGRSDLTPKWRERSKTCHIKGDALTQIQRPGLVPPDRLLNSQRLCILVVHPFTSARSQVI